MKPNQKYSSSNGVVFQINRVYTKEDDNDPWVEYQNVETLQEFSCRQEAFLSRFTPLPD